MDPSGRRKPPPGCMHIPTRLRTRATGPFGRSCCRHTYRESQYATYVWLEQQTHYPKWLWHILRLGELTSRHFTNTLLFIHCRTAGHGCVLEPPPRASRAYQESRHATRAWLEQQTHSRTGFDGRTDIVSRLELTVAIYSNILQLFTVELPGMGA